jgi:hypothetical protein
MTKGLGILLALVALLALVIALGMFCHGLIARAQMKRYKRAPGAKRLKPAQESIQG